MQNFVLILALEIICWYFGKGKMMVGLKAV